MLFSDRRAGGTRRRAQRRRPALTDLPATAPATAGHTNGHPVNGHDAVDSGAVEDATAAPIAGQNGDPNRRVEDRRQIRRRRDDQNPFQRASEEAGWVE
jgi:hypothetical protein